ncbi:hypothetical protein LSH36_252g02036 [Paralvinella palmiformis]|uniref:Uncharacterized protein n=1 Tax=Paralvinella palmiformis TaxID=53620 RepID=A0AAD9JM16_9ANNE|nr:hypothetical protein LSH36_252g02036 [Paralvinella palmiformis]
MPFYLEKYIFWSVYLTLPWITGAAHLKSKGDVTILEGEMIELDWTAYNEGDRIPPCSWQYAANQTDTTSIFLAYASGKQYKFGNVMSWQFTKRSAPCQGGIQKLASSADTGIYKMEVETGYALRSEDTETFVQVYRGSDLKFSIIVNDEVHTLDLSGGPNLKLDLLHTAEPVNVTVVLSQIFPPTTLTITRDASEIVCNNLERRCNKIIELGSMENAAIVVIMKTGIVGADPVIISQPVLHAIPADNGTRNAAITFAVLFFIFLVAFIGFIIFLVVARMKVHKMTKADETSKSDSPESGLIQHTRENLREAANNLKDVFSLKRSCVLMNKLKDLDKENKHQIDTIQKRITNNQKSYDSKVHNFYGLVSSTDVSAQSILKDWDRIMEEMTTAKNNIHIPKLYMDSATDVKDLMTALQNELRSYEDNMKRNDLILKQSKLTESGHEVEDDVEDTSENEERREWKETILVSINADSIYCHK